MKTMDRTAHEDDRLVPYNGYEYHVTARIMDNWVRYPEGVWNEPEINIIEIYDIENEVLVENPSIGLLDECLLHF